MITCHINITEEDIDQLIAAVTQISREYGQDDDTMTCAGEAAAATEVNPIYKKILINRRYKIDVREVLAADSELLPATECLGRISAEIKYRCPPGFPVLVYGEEILAEHVELFGSQEKLKVMKQE